ncbi:MAG: sigma 54-interacting transcriptional regulator [Terriglobia bacterium]
MLHTIFLVFPPNLRKAKWGIKENRMFIKIHRQNDEENHVDSCNPTGNALGPFVSPAMQTVESIIANLALTDIPILIAGETGTGKEVAALTIHERSRRRDAPFIRLRCASLKPEDFDQMSSLGEAEGETLRRGTVFLDEIADLSPACQARLLESFSRLDGEGSEKFQLAACVISTSCRNMDEAMQSGRFRRDLYYRLSGVCIWLPPLRQRKEDVAPLAKFFLDKYARLYGRPRPQISPAMADRLSERSWPGNVRELENTMKRLVALGGEPRDLREFGEWPAEASNGLVEIEAPSLKQAARAASRQVERELILKVLSRTRWNRKRAAEELQISYKALLYKLKQIGLEGPAS